MDIQAANTPTKAKAAASDKQDKSKVEDAREGAPAFAQLLQGLQPPAALEARAAAQDALEARQLPADQLVQVDSAVLRDGLSTGLDLGSLVGQTALLDDRADAALQNGSLALAQQAAWAAPGPAGWRGASASMWRQARLWRPSRPACSRPCPGWRKAVRRPRR